MVFLLVSNVALLIIAQVFVEPVDNNSDVNTKEEFIIVPGIKKVNLPDEINVNVSNISDSHLQPRTGNNRHVLNFGSHNSNSGRDPNPNSNPGTKKPFIHRPIIFPGSNTLRPVITTSKPGGNTNTDNSPIIPFRGVVEEEPFCNITQGQIYFKGECLNLLRQSICNEGEWLVIDDKGSPFCDVRPCEEGQLLFKEECVNVSEGYKKCGPFEMLYMVFTGNVYCDCEPKAVYDKNSYRCEVEHSKGSCPHGQMLELDSDSIVQCVPNPCKVDGLILNTKNDICYHKKFLGRCKDKGFELHFSDNDRSVDCVNPLLNRNIFEVPALTSCPGGSRRDVFGQCQRVFRSDNPLFYRAPTHHVSRYSSCLPNHTRFPDGSCRKVNSIFYG